MNHRKDKIVHLFALKGLALNAHLDSPHFQAAAAKLEALVAAAPDIRQYHLLA